VVNSANGEHPTGLLAGWIRVLRDQVRVPNGELTYTYVEHPGSVFVVPVTRDGRVALIRSYRYPVDEWCWEVPAGALHDKAGRSLEEIARAEMFEEAGCAGGDLQALGSYWTANGVAEDPLLPGPRRRARRRTRAQAKAASLTARAPSRCCSPKPPLFVVDPRAVRRRLASR
jgi:ADP-ribose pyrophosphatase YjhB (NUDIX family)